MAYNPILVLILTLSFSRTVSTAPHYNLGNLVDQLFKKTEELQTQKQTEFIPLLSWQQDVGVYESHVKLNFHGSSEKALFRDEFAVFDNNMFVTAWVTTCLLEAYRYGGAPRPSNPHLKLALSSINQYRNQNIPYANSLMTFWPQIYNTTSEAYVSTPVNLIKMFDLTNDLPLKAIEEILTLLGFKDISNIIKDLLSSKEMFRSAFQIPPDFDDTFVNLGLGALLTDLKTEFPTEQQSWSTSNSNLSTVFDALKKYAYQPFSDHANVNTIDPRSYYYLSSFLEEADQQSRNLALIPTWVQNIDEARVLKSKGVAMPFNVNNVDVTVSANVIYGITASVLSGIVPVKTLDDPVLQKIYLNSTSMISFQLKNDFIKRRDLALTYYPSVVELYWFVARTVFLLNEKSQSSKLPHPAMDTVLAELEPVLEGHVTERIQSEAKVEGPEMVYFDDFLGDGDLDKNNQTIVKGEDRIFTTAMAVNTLLSTWTRFNDTSNLLSWKQNVPPSVKTLVSRCINWLVKYTLSDDFKPWNAFFTGSVKTSGTLPFFYPVNRLEYLNGTKITDYQHFPTGGPYTIGFQGVVPKATYDKMVDGTHFGMKTPTTFDGFNSGSSYFPLWSSRPYTYATTLLAVSQFNNLSN